MVISPKESGTITSDQFYSFNNPPKKYPHRATVEKSYTILANPVSDYIFKNWTIAKAEGKETVENAQITIPIFVDGKTINVVAVANFEKKELVELDELEEPEELEIAEPDSEPEIVVTENTDSELQPWEINPDEWEKIETPMGPAWRKKEVVEETPEEVVTEETIENTEITTNTETTETTTNTETKEETGDGPCFINTIIR